MRIDERGLSDIIQESLRMEFEINPDLYKASPGQITDHVHHRIARIAARVASEYVVAHASGDEWQRKAEEIAAATGENFVVGVRGYKEGSWFAACGGEEIDGEFSSLPWSMTSLLVSKLHRDAHETRILAEIAQSKLDALAEVMNDRGDAPHPG